MRRVWLAVVVCIVTILVRPSPVTVTVSSPQSREAQGWNASVPYRVLSTCAWASSAASQSEAVTLFFLLPWEPGSPEETYVTPKCLKTSVVGVKSPENTTNRLLMPLCLLWAHYLALGRLVILAQTLDLTEAQNDFFFLMKSTSDPDCSCPQKFYLEQKACWVYPGPAPCSWMVYSSWYLSLRWRQSSWWNRLQLET